MYQDDTMDRFIPKRLKRENREQYKGNKNPSAQEYAREGYATLRMADPKAIYGNTLEDRDTLSRDADTSYDPMIRHIW